MVAVWAGRTCQPEAAWQRGRPATRQTSGNLTGNLPPGLRDRPTALAHRRAILAAMYAAAVKHLGGISQLLGSILMLQEVLAFACDQGELVTPVGLATRSSGNSDRGAVAAAAATTPGDLPGRGWHRHRPWASAPGT